MQRQTTRDILRRTLHRTAAERNDILPGGQASKFPMSPQDRHSSTTFSRHFYEGSEDRMFADLNISRALFFTALNVVDSVPLQRRGRPSFVNTHRDKLLFLIVFLTNGTMCIETLCIPRLTSVAGVLHHAHDAAERFA